MKERLFSQSSNDEQERVKAAFSAVGAHPRVADEAARRFAEIRRASAPRQIEVDSGRSFDCALAFPIEIETSEAGITGRLAGLARKTRDGAGDLIAFRTSRLDLGRKTPLGVDVLRVEEALAHAQWPFDST